MKTNYLFQDRGSMLFQLVVAYTILLVSTLLFTVFAMSLTMFTENRDIVAALAFVLTCPFVIATHYYVYTRARYRSTNIPLQAVTATAAVRRIPMVGQISAGEPLPETEQAELVEYVDVPGELVPDSIEDVYALRVKGNSMIDALITDGDLVLMRYQATAKNGQMVAVHVVDRNEYTLKKIYFEGDSVRLQPMNPTMAAWHEPSTNIEVQGRVVGVVRSLS